MLIIIRLLTITAWMLFHYFQTAMEGPTSASEEGTAVLLDQQFGTHLPTGLCFSGWPAGGLGDQEVPDYGHTLGGSVGDFQMGPARLPDLLEHFAGQDFLQLETGPVGGDLVEPAPHEGDAAVPGMFLELVRPEGEVVHLLVVGHVVDHQDDVGLLDAADHPLVLLLRLLEQQEPEQPVVGPAGHHPTVGLEEQPVVVEGGAGELGGQELLA